MSCDLFEIVIAAKLLVSLNEKSVSTTSAINCDKKGALGTAQRQGFLLIIRRDLIASCFEDHGATLVRNAISSTLIIPGIIFDNMVVNLRMRSTSILNAAVTETIGTSRDGGEEVLCEAGVRFLTSQWGCINRPGAMAC